MDTYSKCQHCGEMKQSSKVVCEHCGAEIISQQDFMKAMDEIMAHIGIDMSTKGDFVQQINVPNAFVGFLGKTEDGKVELAKKEIVKAFDINKTMDGGKK